LKDMKGASKISIAALVPANNEEKVITKTLEAILKLVPKEDLYVVDDGSEDETLKISQKYTKNVLSTSNQGKAHALNSGIKYFGLTKRYNYIFFMDADSKPKWDFLDKMLVHFKNDTNGEIICVVGRVKGSSKNWISKYRQWEYQLSYLVHKRAQELLGSILVTPGCATLYRSFIFDKLEFPIGTLTEDMDFTFQMHRLGFNKMVFESKAIVYTIDPQNLRDFIKQLSRWYTGFWQVVRKHDIPWQGQMLDLEVSVLATEGLYNGLLVIFFLISMISLSFFGIISILVIPLLLDLLLFFIPSLIWSSFSDKDYTRIFFIPHFYLLRFLSSIIFLKSYFDGFLSSEKEYVWNSNRYKQGDEV